MTQRCRFILCQPSHPGNIGATARAMKVMGWNDLVLVAPQCPFPDPVATARSAGATDVLDNARCTNTLAEALDGVHLAMATSARRRTQPWPRHTPEALGTMVQAQPMDQTVAVVFGNEQHGLSNEDLHQCHGQVIIPTAPDYRSLNLAAAVQILAYALRISQHGATSEPPSKQAERYSPATVEACNGFFNHLERVLTRLNFFTFNNTTHTMNLWRCLINRAQPLTNELAMLRGLCSAIEMHVLHDDKAQPRPGDQRDA